jgi:hypothetical protein
MWITLNGKDMGFWSPQGGINESVLKVLQNSVVESVERSRIKSKIATRNGLGNDASTGGSCAKGMRVLSIVSYSANGDRGGIVSIQASCSDGATINVGNNQTSGLVSQTATVGAINKITVRDGYDGFVDVAFDGDSKFGPVSGGGSAGDVFDNKSKHFITGIYGGTEAKGKMMLSALMFELVAA